MINSVCGIRSTGRICTDIAEKLDKNGHEVRIAYGRDPVPDKFSKYAIKIGTNQDIRLHALRARLFDGSGWGSKRITKRFVKWIEEYEPDVIHLHNIHGYYLNIEVLFDYLSTYKGRIIWTLHDCWAFTGHAAFCEAVNCERWKVGCHDCPKKTDYPKSILDNSRKNWKRKKRVVQGVSNITIVSPSKWLNGLIRSSFLSSFNSKVIYNGIDTTVFRPVPTDNIREKLGIGKERVILGVAAIWNTRKGLSDFIKLSSMISDEYRIVIVGLTKKQIMDLPERIIGIERTDSVDELVELYSLAYVFFNPTYEDNYPTTNLEAISCGTPVITYDTGGSGESACFFGKIIPKGDLSGFVNMLECVRIIDRIENDFSISSQIQKYYELYS